MFFYWEDGVVEYWEKLEKTTSPTLQYSNKTCKIKVI
jgi:hypothetical protein